MNERKTRYSPECLPSPREGKVPADVTSLIGLLLVGVGALVVAPISGGVGTPFGRASQLIPFGTLLILLAGLTSAVVVWKVSKVGAVHLTQVATYFGVGALVESQYSMSYLATMLVFAWILTVAGALLLQPRREVSARIDIPRPNAGHFVIGLGLSSTHLYLALLGSVGLQAQLAEGVSANGLSSTLVTIAPIFAMAVLVSCIIARQWLIPAMLLVILQAFASACSGFRGAVFTLATMTIVGLLIALPKDHPMRRVRNMGAAIVALIALGVIFFWVGADSRARIASSAGRTSAGTAVVDASEFLPFALSRMSLGPFLDVAVNSRGVSPPPTVLWSGQAVAVIPRFIYPSKPSISYGIEVSRSYYGIMGDSASTLTWLGDIWVNGGGLLLWCMALLYAAAIGSLERKLPRLGRFTAMPLVAVLASSVGYLESTIPLMMVTLVRAFLFLFVLWGVPLRFSMRTKRRSIGSFGRPATQGGNR